jgi:hypothetical protein
MSSREPFRMRDSHASSIEENICSFLSRQALPMTRRLGRRGSVPGSVQRVRGKALRRADAGPCSEQRRRIAGDRSVVTTEHEHNGSGLPLASLQATRHRTQLNGYDLTPTNDAAFTRERCTSKYPQAIRAARQRATHSIALPTCNEKVSSRITPCAVRRSHFYRAKFIPEFSVDGEQSFRRFWQ